LYPDEARQVIQNLLTRKADFAWLFPTDETPADDPVALPYHLSSHILLWHCLRQLHAYLPDEGYVEMAEQVRSAVFSYFVGEHEGNPCLAYATDGQGHFSYYHDANDVPLILAPLWGFMPADDLLWQNTIAFALSPANRGGFYDGHIGSVHTPAPWPLGDVQLLLIGHLRGDAAMKQLARESLRRAAQWDGALPEAYDSQDYSVVSRTWFAWPNALYTWARLRFGLAEN
jgi:hypothetical protein